MFREANKFEREQIIDILHYSAPNNKPIHDKVEFFFNTRARKLLQESKDLKNEKIACRKCFNTAFEKGLIEVDKEAFEKCRTMELIKARERHAPYKTFTGVPQDCHSIELTFECYVCKAQNCVMFDTTEIKFTEEMLKTVRDFTPLENNELFQ